LPKDFNGLLHLIKCYLVLLDVVVGTKCFHFTFVRLIGRAFSGNRQAFENMTARDVATIVWQMFLDSRRFFTEAINVTGIQPMSRLEHLLGFINVGTVPQTGNVPFNELVGTTAVPPVIGAPVGAPAREARRETPGQHLALTFDVPAAIATIYRGCLTRYPEIGITQVMLATNPPTSYLKYKLGPSGTCMDFVCFGKCTNPSCNFKHRTDIVISPNQLSRATPNHKFAFDEYKAAQT
jgi:hypothetical protein